MSENMNTSMTAPDTSSTQSIVEAAVADLPDTSTESGGYGAIDATVEPDSAEAASTTTASTVPGSTTQTAPQAEIDELAQALGITDQGKGKWTARVAYSKLHKVIKERDEKRKAEHEAALRQSSEQFANVQRQIAEFDRMVASPEHLLSALAQVHPAYGAYLARSGAAPAPSQAHDTPPQFNTAADLQQYVQSQIDRHVSERLAPIERERQSRQVLEAAIPRVRQQLAEAEKLPMFSESKAEILAALQKNPEMGLHDAYMSIVVPKLAAGRDQVRQDVLAELKSRPHSTTVTSTVSGRAVSDAEPASTEDIVRAAIRQIRD